MAALACLLGDPQSWLLILVGPGGIGKIRLAIEAPADQRQRFTDEVYFACRLMSLRFIIPAVADALRFGFSGLAELQAQPVNHLSGKSLLLLLDSFEH